MLSTDVLASKGYDTVIVAATDVQGRLFGRRVPLRRFLLDAGHGIPICTCTMAWDITQDLAQEVPFAGWHTGWHDFIIKPDLSTLRPYPGVAGTAICMADIVDEETEELLSIAPRTILRRQLERAARQGITVLLASELEFYLFKGEPRELRRRNFRDLVPTTVARSDYSIVNQGAEEPFIARVRREMDAAGIPIYACQAEYGFGQWEVNLDYCEALEMADRHVIYKSAIKEIAAQADMTVTFMAKPHPTEFGSSGHFHCSLRRDDVPLFPEEHGSRKLSDLGKGFLAGLVTHLNETALCFAPFVNSYKRHVPDSVGGGLIAWGLDNRTVTFRLIGAGDSLRIEHRYAGADVNPYLAAAAIVAAGLDGIERSLDPGPPFKGNAYQAPDLPHAPASLGDALKVFEASPFAVAAFGQDVVDHYVAHARGEWTGYLRAVTDWEIQRAFELV